MKNSRSDAFHALVNFFRLNSKQTNNILLRGRDLARNSGKLLHHISPGLWEVAFAFIQCIYNTNQKKKKKKKKEEDYHKRCQHAGQRVWRRSAQGCFEIKQRLVSVTHFIPRNRRGRRERASQSNMCASSWKGYTIPATFNLILSNLTGVRDCRCMD